MEGISDIKITGIDDKRPPVIRKEPYIDLYFKLSHQAPSLWCKDFNAILSKHPFTPRISEKEGLYIEAWVRKPDEIIVLLKQLKETVIECTRRYIERVELSMRNNDDANALVAKQGGGEQGRLNKIIAELDFGDI